MSGPVTPPEEQANYTTLEGIMRSALRRAGNFSPNRVTGEVVMMLIEFANEVLQDVRQHPYWDQACILEDYVSQTESRPVNDTIILEGILARYFYQQGSSKFDTQWKKYQSILNDRLYHQKYGVQRHFIQPFDRPQLEAYEPLTSPLK